MSQAASSFVRRHLIKFVNRTKKTLLLQIADVANNEGRVRDYTQRDAADDMGAALPTVKRAFQALQRADDGAPGPFLVKLGKGRYELVGFHEHDGWRCGNDECLAEAEAARHAPGRLSEKKRAQAAARARAFRSRRRDEREAARIGR